MIVCAQCRAQNWNWVQVCKVCGASLSNAPAAAALSSTSPLGGRYRMDHELGRGSFGAAYLAEDIRLKRPCVVKHLLIPSGATQREIDDLTNTFAREAEALVSLNQPGHPNIPEIYDFFSDSAGNYLVMKYIQGESLEQRLQNRGPMPWQEAVALALQVADALAYMHGRRPPVLHRDIKPANLLLDDTGRAWLVDFGLSKAQPASGGKTGLSEPMGTPGYAPHEQYQRGEAVPASDVYALAATFYFLVTGDDPADHPFVFDQIAWLPAGLQQPVRRALDPMPGPRPSAAAWKADLELLVRPAGPVQPLAFPQNEAAADLAGLAAACARHWEYGKRILYDGTLERWLRTALHDPLTADKAAEITRLEKDQDVGIDRLIREMAPSFPPPVVAMGSSYLDGGAIPWGENRQLALVVGNAGYGTLQATVSSPELWISVSPASLSCVAGASKTLTVTVDSGKLDGGSAFQGALLVEGGPGGRVHVPVVGSVPAPCLSLQPQSLDLGSAYQGETLRKAFHIQNTGGSAFEANLTGVGWLSVEPRSCRVAPGKSAAVAVSSDTSSLPVGRHSASVQVQARAGRWQQSATLPVAANLPWLKTAWHRQTQRLLAFWRNWRRTLDWVMVSALLGLTAFLLATLLVPFLPPIARVAQGILLAVAGLIGAGIASIFADDDNAVGCLLFLGALGGFGVGFWAIDRPGGRWALYLGIALVGIVLAAVGAGVGYLLDEPSKRRGYYLCLPPLVGAGLVIPALLKGALRLDFGRGALLIGPMGELGWILAAAAIVVGLGVGLALGRREVDELGLGAHPFRGTGDWAVICLLLLLAELSLLIIWLGGR